MMGEYESIPPRTSSSETEIIRQVGHQSDGGGFAAGVQLECTASPRNTTGSEGDAIGK